MRFRGLLTLLVLFGAMYAFPVLSQSIADDLRTSRTVLQGAFALWGIAVAAYAPLAGHILDQCGSRTTLLLGCGAFIGTLIGLAAAQAVWQIYVLLLAGGAPAYVLLYLGTLVAASRIGTQGRGGALGLSGAGTGIGLTLLLPAAVWLSTLAGWRVAFLALAGLMIPVAALIIVLPGATASAPTTVAAPHPWHRLIRSRPFVLLFIGGASIGVIDETLYQHLVPALTATGVPLAQAAAILGLVSLGYIGGQVAGGISSDRWGRWWAGCVAGLLVGAALGLLASVALHGVGLALAALGSGAGLGATLAVRSATLADRFDGPALGMITGVYQWAYAIGGSTIGWAGAYVYERFGSYTAVFAAAAAAALIWLVCLHAAAYRMPGRREQHSAAVG
jgi:MFS transporter, OFA family, oxalate/formate antiporter